MKLCALILLLALAAGATAQTHLGIVKLDNVTNTLPAVQNSLSVGHVHRVSIRFDLRANASGAMWTGSNAFEVYSPDGADWRYLKGSDGPLVTAPPPTALVFRKHYYSTNGGTTYTATSHAGTDSAGGSGGSNTRVAYSLAAVDPTGLWGFVGGSANDIAIYIEFGTRHQDVGYTICFDSLNGKGTPPWEWASSVGSDFPRWDNGLGVSGPRCWTLSMACNCCDLHVGDVNGEGGDVPTVGDVSAMVDGLFITGGCAGIAGCLYEADINLSGECYDTRCADITIGDVAALIDYLFITGPAGMDLPECQ